jgi:pimeloyl-ACP methyl ester carboxylesterase
MTRLYGLDELYAPENATVDIVFVHGISGHRRDTWTKEGVLWPRDLLPTVVPDARILTFGYEAAVIDLNDEVTQTTMETHAVDLCDRLTGLRLGTPSSERPIVFVAHSLGGLVCAQAIVKGGEGVQSDNSSITAACCTGIVFLGTPFYGSAPAKYLDVLRKVVEVFCSTNTKKIHDLKETSEKLGLLVESFASRLHQRLAAGEGVEVQFFYETLKTHGVLIVPESNARIIGYGAHASIHANHIDMCKFSSEKDEGYKSVSAAIRKLVKMEKKHPKPIATTYTWNNSDNAKIGQQVGTQNVSGGLHFH